MNETKLMMMDVASRVLTMALNQNTINTPLPDNIKIWGASGGSTVFVEFIDRNRTGEYHAASVEYNLLEGTVKIYGDLVRVKMIAMDALLFMDRGNTNDI